MDHEDPSPEHDPSSSRGPERGDPDERFLSGEREPPPKGAAHLPWREHRFAPLEPPPDWRPTAGPELFTGESTRDVLRRIFDGDPLRIERLVSHRVEAMALMLDMSDLVLDTLARIAHDAPDFERGAPFAAWLDARACRSIRAQLRRDIELEHEGALIAAPLEPRCLYLAALLGIEPTMGRRACVAFNALPPEERLVFFAVKIAGKSIRRHVAEGHGPPELARARLRRAMRALLEWGGRPGGDPPEEPRR